MIDRPVSAVRAATPFVALVAALALVLPFAPAPRAADRVDGSLDIALAEAPPYEHHEGPPAHPRGALVIGVETGGAGDRGGLIEGDLIIEFENHAVNSAAELAGMIRREGGGSHVSIWVWRDGSRKWMGLVQLSGHVPAARIAEENGALRDEVAGMRAEVAALRVAIGDQHAELGDVHAELAALHDDVDSLRAAVARLRPRRTPARVPPPAPIAEPPMR